MMALLLCIDGADVVAFKDDGRERERLGRCMVQKHQKKAVYSCDPKRNT